MKTWIMAASLGTCLCLALPRLVSALRAAEIPSSKETLAEIAADLDGDGVKDRVVLLHDRTGDNTTDVDLAIYLSSSQALADKPTTYKTAFGSTGDMDGTKPSLRQNRAGSLVVAFQNDAIGRDRYQQQYTIGFRGGVLVVAGYSYQTRDSLSPDRFRSCDIDFLSGTGKRDGKAVKVAASAIPLASWTDKSLPAACAF